jgi:hypothetical protein
MLLTTAEFNQIQNNGNLIQNIKSNIEYITYNEQPLLDYFVTTYPRQCSNDIPQLNVQLAYADNNPYKSFENNQGDVILASQILFEGSLKMDKIQQDILDIAFAKSLIDKPTRPNRK